jgi:hypothetical protein
MTPESTTVHRKLLAVPVYGSMLHPSTAVHLCTSVPMRLFAFVAAACALAAIVLHNETTLQSIPTPTAYDQPHSH